LGRQFDPTTEHSLIIGHYHLVERALLPWQLVRVSGPSMSPTLRHGDLLLIVRARTAAVGDVVVAVFRSMPDRLVVKRVRALDDGGVELVSDNAFAGGDSATHGIADVQGRVLLVRRSGSWRPRRVR